MRSNNALRLLPYNLFEYTMLAELIATELDVEMGAYWHYVNSLHVFEEELDSARALISSDNEPMSGESAMPAMPRGQGGLEQAVRLVEGEKRLRSAVLDKDRQAVNNAVERAEAELLPYWFGLFSVLALFATARAGASGHLDTDWLLDRIPPALRGPLIEP
jgi:hypothetical protein